MKAKFITYSRLISKGNFENAKIEICMEVEEGEKAYDVFMQAKAFVERRIEIEKTPQNLITHAQKVLADKRNHTLVQIEDAEEILSKFEPDFEDDLPF